MLTDRLDVLLADYHRPEPVPNALSRRIAAAGRRGERDLERLVDRFSIDASERGIASVGRGRLLLPARGAARRLVEQAREELREFFGGRRVYFSVPVDLGGLPQFQKKVLRQTTRIPFGEARSYSWLAARIGHPRAARAVGTALGRNPVPFIVPCHRILRDDGSLGGYGLGLDLKRRILGLERTSPILEGSTGAGIVCRVGCPALRRVRADRRVVFASVADARSVGYRPCRVCRPDHPPGGVPA